ncbi:hypothetical protein C8F01DRAFT_1243955 [Mycena amicta]|nr:hypothetical protein C8F01DRAFT_1243955 [Mycena amicta]
MALPEHFTTLDLSGRFALNHELSTVPSGEIQAPWKDVSPAAWGELAINHFKDEDDGQERMWLAQELRGQPPTEKEWIVDWQERQKQHEVFGVTMGQMRRVKTHELDAHFLRAGWTSDTRKHGVLQRRVWGTWQGREWTVMETFGIEEIDGQRRFARHVRTTVVGSDGQEKQVNDWRLVCDYVGPIH